MEAELENPATAAAAPDYATDDMDDSCCSTPYVSAPSSPGRNSPLAGFYYSAPASPTHFILSTAALTCSYPSAGSAVEVSSSFEFDLSSTFPSAGVSSPESMTSADELFFNGQIRPMKLSAHLQRPQHLAPLIECDDGVEDDHQTFSRGRDLKLRTGSLRRRTRSMSPHRTSATTSFQWLDSDDPKLQNDDSTTDTNKNGEEEKGSTDNTPCNSRSSSAGRSSRRWVFLKEFLYRSKSEGRNDGHKFWSSISFSPNSKEKKIPQSSTSNSTSSSSNSSNSKSKHHQIGGKNVNTNPKSSGGKKRASAHELHYTANRAQAEELRRKTFLPYRQGLLGCLGFSSKSYTAMNGFARALNPVSSRNDVGFPL